MKVDDLSDLRVSVEFPQNTVFNFLLLGWRREIHVEFYYWKFDSRFDSRMMMLPHDVFSEFPTPNFGTYRDGNFWHL